MSPISCRFQPSTLFRVFVFQNQNLMHAFIPSVDANAFFERGPCLALVAPCTGERITHFSRQHLEPFLQKRKRIDVDGRRKRMENAFQT